MANKQLTNKDSVAITARRWFQKSFGNTYFSARIIINGEMVHDIPVKYGYGEHCIEVCCNWLSENGYLDNPRTGSANLPRPLWQMRDAIGFKLFTEINDVNRKKDL